MITAIFWIRDRIVSFFEESPGVMSSTRLVMVTIAACIAVMTVTTREYLLRAGKPEAMVVTAAGGVITALLGGLAYVTGKRE